MLKSLGQHSLNLGLVLHLLVKNAKSDVFKICQNIFFIIYISSLSQNVNKEIFPLLIFRNWRVFWAIFVVQHLVVVFELIWILSSFENYFINLPIFKISNMFNQIFGFFQRQNIRFHIFLVNYFITCFLQVNILQGF